MSSIRTCPRPLLVVAVIGAVSADWSVFIRCKCYTLVKLLGFCKFAVAFGRASASLGLRLKGTLGTGKQLGMEQEWRWAFEENCQESWLQARRCLGNHLVFKFFRYQIISQGERGKKTYEVLKNFRILNKRGELHIQNWYVAQDSFKLQHNGY